MHCLIEGAPGASTAPAWLGTLLAQAAELPACQPDPLDPHTPAERWLGHLHGLPDEAALPLAAWTLRERSRPWCFVSPVHLQLEAAQVLALPQQALALSEADSRTLFALMAPLFPAAEGWELQWLSPLQWALAHEQLDGLRLASLRKAEGRPLTPWLPEDRRLRRWTNEVQMLWHEQPLNRARAEAGLPAVNSIWWWGAGRFAGEPPEALQQHEGWPTALELPAGSVLALAGERQVRSFEIGARRWWQRLLGGRAPDAATLLASL